MLSTQSEFLTDQGWSKQPKGKRVLCWRYGVSFWRQCDQISISEGPLFHLKASNNLELCASAETLLPLYVPKPGGLLVYGENTFQEQVDRFRSNPSGSHRRHICTVSSPNKAKSGLPSDYYRPLVGALLYGEDTNEGFRIQKHWAGKYLKPGGDDVVYSSSQSLGNHVDYTQKFSDRFSNVFNMDEFQRYWLARHMEKIAEAGKKRTVNVLATNPDWLQIPLMFSGYSVTANKDGITMHKKIGLTPARYSVDIEETLGERISCPSMPFVVTRFNGKVTITGAE